MFFVDLDHFKEVNDSYGHGAGDELLIRVAERLESAVRPSDTVARMSGDEFVILCEALSDAALADTILQRVEHAFSAPFLIDGHELNVTASIGTAVDAGGNDLPAELLRGADQAMYQTKRRDGNVAAPGEGDETDDGIIEDLRGAAARGELRLDFQPIVDTQDRRLKRRRSPSAVDTSRSRSDTAAEDHPARRKIGTDPRARPLDPSAGVG